MITLEQLKAIMLHGVRLNIYLPHLNKAMAEMKIDTLKRQAAFIAQIAHETGELKWMEEIWGPTEAQKRYEKSKELGNTQSGDGHRFKGRGAFQLTGRANYKTYGDWLKLDLENHPELASAPENTFRIAAKFWNTHNLNAAADSGDFALITRKINGGLNGLTERMKYWAKATEVLG